jgi:hypothetical protein
MGWLGHPLIGEHLGKVGNDPWPLPCPWFVGPVKPTPKMSFANIRPAAKAVSGGEFPSLAGIKDGFLCTAPTIAKAAFDLLSG